MPRKLNWGREARRLQRLSSAGCRPGAGGGAGAWERGRPGPGAARPPAALGAVARAAGLADPLGPARHRCTLCSSARAGREAATAPSAQDRLRRGAGQLGLQGGPRQHHGGRIVAKGGGGGCSALGTRRRRQRRSLLLLLLPPPPLPARVWEGASRDECSVRAGAATAAFSSTP